MAEAMPYFAQLAEKTDAPLQPLRKDKKLVNFALLGVSAEAKGLGIGTALTKYAMDALAQRFDAAYLGRSLPQAQRPLKRTGSYFSAKRPIKTPASRR